MDVRTYTIVAGAALMAVSWTFIHTTAGTAPWSALSSAVDALEGVVRSLWLFDGPAFWKFYAALFAIMNPLVVIPLFVSLTEGRPAAYRSRIALIATLTVTAALMITAVFGREILGFFAISIGAFRIAGGIIVLSMGWAMLKSDGFADGGHHDSASRAVCPLAIPLLAGPGAIATIIVQCEAAAVPGDYATLGSVLAAMVFTTWITLRAAAPVARLLGTTGLTITTRLLGMVVSAIAIDMAMIGVKLLFPALV